MSRQTLADVLARDGVYATRTGLQILLLIADALENLHQQGRLYGNLRPETIGLDEAGRVRLAARRGTLELGGTGNYDAQRCPPELNGTALVVLPEGLSESQAALLAAGARLDARRIDVYQCAAVTLQVLLGADVLSYLRRPQVGGQLAAPLRNEIERALGFQPATRYHTISELAEGLRKLLPAEEKVVSKASPAGGNIADIELPFKQLKQYRILSRLGSGGMGDVYVAHDTSLNRKVAIKVLPPELARHKDFVDRFRAEATAAAKLAHPNIVPIYFIGEDAGHHFFAMQLVEGESLATRLARQPALSQEQVLDIVKQMLSALSAAHAQGLIHRDVKPGNILLEKATGRALLADFGLVRQSDVSTRLTSTGMIMGTLDYIAPEQARGKAVDYRADLYSVGVLLYQMLSGQLPFESDTPTGMMFQHAYEQPTPLELVCPGIPLPLSLLVSRLMAKSPDERHRNCEEVLADLRKINQTPATPSPPPLIIADLPQIDTTVPPKGTPRPDLWQAIKGRAASLFHNHAPEVLHDLQSTQQQIDGVVAHYERHRDRLAGLVREAESAFALLSQQVESCRRSLAAARSEQDRAVYQAELQQLQQQAAEQQDQLEEMRLQLAQTDARLLQLRSQNDALNARLRLAQAQLQIEGGAKRKRRPVMTMTVIGGVFLFGLVFAARWLNKAPEQAHVTPAQPIPTAVEPGPVDPEPISPVKKVDSPLPTLPPAPVINPRPKPRIQSTSSQAYTATAQNPPPTEDKSNATNYRPPAPMADWALGGGGRLLILYLKDLNRLDIFDVVDAKVVGTIPLPSGEEVKFAAGREKLVLSLPSAGVLQRWDLATCRRELTVPVSDKFLHTLAMGCDSSGPLFYCAQNDTQMTVGFLAVDTLTSADLEFKNGEQKLDLDKRKFHNLRSFASADGETFTLSDHLFVCEGGKVRTNSTNSDEYIIPSADGDLVFTAYGIHTNQMLRAGATRLQWRGVAAVPSVQGDYIVTMPLDIPRASWSPFSPAVPFEQRIQSLGVQISRFGNSRALTTIPNVDLSSFPRSTFDLHRLYYHHVFFLPELKRLVIVSPEFDRVDIYQVDLERTNYDSPDDDLQVISRPQFHAHVGEPYRYQLAFRSNREEFHCRLVTGPPGMIVSPSGLVEWSPLQRGSKIFHTVRIAIRKKLGLEVLHTYLIHLADKFGRPVNSVSEAVVESDEKIEFPNFALPVISPANLAADQVEYELPGNIENVAIGGGGRYLVFSTQGRQSLMVFDTSAAKIIHEIPYGDPNTVFAAGAEKLITVEPGAGRMTRWNLASAEREASVQLAPSDNAFDIAMGYASNGPLLVSPLLAGGLHLYDVMTMRVIEVDSKKAGIRKLLLPSPESRAFGIFSEYVTIDSDSIRIPDKNLLGPYVLPHLQSRQFFTGNGIFNWDWKYLDGPTEPTRRSIPPAYASLPAIGGPFFVRAKKNSAGRPSALELLVQGEQSPFATVEDSGLKLADYQRFSISGKSLIFPLYKRIFLIPAAKLLVTLPEARDKLILTRVDVDELLRQSDHDFLAITSIAPSTFRKGELFEYQIQVISNRGGVTYKLESGPAGMVVSDSGEVTWPVPAGYPQDEAKALVLVRDLKGVERFQSISLSSESDKPAKVPPANGMGQGMQGGAGGSGGGFF